MSTTSTRKILKREVMAAHDRWAGDMSRWGDDNLATVRSAIAWREARERWEREQGKVWTWKGTRR